jgi:hypothetical protein
MAYWIKSNGVVYEGDCQLGDTAATPAQTDLGADRRALRFSRLTLRRTT